MDFPVVTNIEHKRIPNPSTPIQEGFTVSTASIKFDSGHEQSRKKGATLSTFQLNYTVLSDDAYQTIRSFFLSCTNVVSFNWTHPISKVVYKCKFDGSSFGGTTIGNNGQKNLWTCKFNITEVP